MVLDGEGQAATGHPNAADLLAPGLPAPQVSFAPSTHLAVLPYSSGTTGNPKGVMLTHRNLVANVAQIRPLHGMVADDVVLAVLPFFHIYGMTVLLNAALHARARLVMMPSFDLGEFLGQHPEPQVHDRVHRTAGRRRAGQASAGRRLRPVVAAHRHVGRRPAGRGSRPRRRQTVRLPGGAGLRDERAQPGQPHAPRSTAACEIMAMVAPLELGRLDRVQRGLQDSSIPTTGDEIDAPAEGLSETGELWFKGPNVMAGYLGNEQATRETIDDEGWLHTGDLARVDSSGCVYIVDRLKELIKYKGYQVPPAELEAVLLSHPGDRRRRRDRCAAMPNRRRGAKGVRGQAIRRPN